MVTGLVKKDTDSVIPISRDTNAERTKPGQARCPPPPPEIINTPPRAHLVERGGTVTPSAHHYLWGPLGHGLRPP